MRQKVTLMLLAILFSFGLQAQTGGQVTGKVIDAMGELPGVSVVIKGTSNGTITDLNGQFTLSDVKSTDVLVFSFIGYKTQEITVGNQKNISVTMEEDTQTLDEVVVVGYQEVRKKDLTGSVAKANLKDMMSTPVASFDQALSGRVAGVNVSSGEGSPGATMNITIRGNNSLTQDNSPLYVIDGFPVENADASNTINPADIESIDILKDASATAIYGARGANGVVIITTKQGKIGKPQISYDGSFGVSQVSKKLEMMSAYDFVKLQEEISPTDMDTKYYQLYEGHQWTLEDYRNIAQNNYQDEIFRSAWQQNHNVRVTGGTEGIRYNASVSYFDQDGILLESNYKRLQSRLNTMIKRDKLTINLNTNYSRSIKSGNSPSENASSGMNNLFYSVWGYRPVNYPNGTLDDLLNNVIDEDIDSSNDYRFNPIADLVNAYKKYYVNNLQLNGYVEYEFIKGLKLKVSGGYTYDNRHSDTFNNSKTRYGGPLSSDKVNAEIVRQERLTWLNENILTYQTNFKKYHSFNAMLGVTLQNSDYESYSVRTIQIPNESLGMAGMSQGKLDRSTSMKSSWAMLSYLGRINYNYMSKYYVTASFRADGSSKFSKQNRYGYFPSGSLAWSFSEEPFMERFKSWLSNGKLRLSWGLTGNNRIGEYDRFALLDMIKANSNRIPGNVSDHPTTVYPIDGNMNNIGMTTISLPNEDLKWETTEQWNLGIDLGFFDERIGFTADIYRKTTRDLLLDAMLPYSSGYATAMKNIGKVRNDGIELTLNTVNIQTKDFKWSTNFNISFNKNTVLELSENQVSLLSSANFDQNFRGQPNYIAKKGYPMGMMYGYIYEGTYKYDDFNKSGNTYTLKGNVPYFAGESNTQPGMPKYKDLNGDGIINADDRTMIGRGLPIHTGGFTNNFEYKGFDLNIFFRWSYGNDILNANRLFFESGFQKKKDLNQFASFANRWTPENPNSDIPAATNSGSNNVFSSRIIEDGSFLKLQSITLGYTIPKTFLSKYKINNARLYVAASNLWTITGYSGYDPEVSIREGALTPGLDFSAYPRAISVNFGLNLSF
jgi:TonB-linked SusC/RagA family outer membrane protein